MKANKRNQLELLRRRGNPTIILNVKDSPGQSTDYLSEGVTFKATVAGLPEAFDTRALIFPQWSEPFNQGSTGSCVGQATGKLMQWHLYRARVIRRRHIRYCPSRKFLWTASKETDEFEFRPTSMINSAGTSLKACLDVGRKYGAPTERIMPMRADGFDRTEEEFYKLAENYKIKSYHATSPHGSGYHYEGWKRWLATQGPMMVRGWVDPAFARGRGVLNKFDAQRARGYHAYLCVAYRTNKRGETEYCFLNSWGGRWGDGGSVWMTEGYVMHAISESYGIRV